MSQIVLIAFAAVASALPGRLRYINLPSGYIIYNQNPRQPNFGFVSESRARGAKSVAVAIDSSTAKAALAYMNSQPADDVCGKLAKAYMETVIAGGSTDDAEDAARRVYLREWQSGNAPEAGSTCAQSQEAFKNAAASGEDPVLAAGLAFLSSDQSDSPCSAAAQGYVQALVAGKRDAEAVKDAAKAFTRQMKSLSAQGKPTLEPTCSKAALAYVSKTGFSSEALEAAMKAFISKAGQTNNGYDPACVEAFEGFTNAYDSGKPEPQSVFSAAKSFVNIYKNTKSANIESPCTAAALAYISKTDFSRQPFGLAMKAFIEKSLDTGIDYDPACAAAAEQFFAAYESGRPETAALISAGRGFSQSFQGNTPNSPCTAAAKAYASTIPSSSNDGLNEALMAFIDGSDGEVSPACGAAAEAYMSSFTSGATKTQAMAAAGQAYLKVVQSDPDYKPSASCSRAVQAFMSSSNSLL